MVVIFADTGIDPYISLYIPIDPYRPLFMAMVVVFADTGMLYFLFEQLQHSELSSGVFVRTNTS